MEVAKYGLELARDEFADGPRLFSERSLTAVRQMIKFLNYGYRGASVRAFPAIHDDVYFCVTKWSFSREPTAGVPISLLMSGFRPSSPNPQAKEHFVKALRISGFGEEMTEVIARLPRDSGFNATAGGGEETLTLRRPEVRRKLGLLLADFGLASCQWFIRRYQQDLVEACQIKPESGDTQEKPPSVSLGHSDGSGH